MLWLVVVAVVAGEDPPLPGALPPLDDTLLGGPVADDDTSFFGHGRVRAAGQSGLGPEVDDDDDDAVLSGGGASLTGRLGASGSLGDVRGAVVVGDGAWFVWPELAGATTSSLDLVARPLAPFVQRLSIEVPLAPLGAPGQLAVGRLPLVIADGRMVGSEPFDARGRSVDGAVVDANFGTALWRAGAAVLDLGAARDDAGVDPLQLLGFVDVAVDTSALAAVDGDVVENAAVDVYLLLHHRLLVARPTLGARASVDVVGLRLGVGVDGQLALDEREGLQLIDRGLHGEVSARTLLPWSLPGPRPFVEVGGEATGSLVAPAPTQHGTLGNLDLVALPNTAQLWAGVGVDDDSGFLASLTWRGVSALGPTVDPRGAPVSSSGGPLFGELDVDLGLPIADDVDVDIGWAVSFGAPGSRGVGLSQQRLLVGLRFSFGDDDGLLPTL